MRRLAPPAPGRRRRWPRSAARRARPWSRSPARSHRRRTGPGCGTHAAGLSGRSPRPGSPYARWCGRRRRRLSWDGFSAPDAKDRQAVAPYRRPRHVHKLRDNLSKTEALVTDPFSMAVAGLGSIKTELDFSKTLSDARDTSNLLAVKLELQGLLLQAQETQATLIGQKRQLEERVRELEAWEREKEQYELTALAHG